MVTLDLNYEFSNDLLSMMILNLASLRVLKPYDVQPNLPINGEGNLKTYICNTCPQKVIAKPMMPKIPSPHRPTKKIATPMSTVMPTSDRPK